MEENRDEGHKAQAEKAEMMTPRREVWRERGSCCRRGRQVNRAHRSAAKISVVSMSRCSLFSTAKSLELAEKHKNISRVSL